MAIGDQWCRTSHFSRDYLVFVKNHDIESKLTGWDIQIAFNDA